jgi:hypothetical protein
MASPYVEMGVQVLITVNIWASLLLVVLALLPLGPLKKRINILISRPVLGLLLSLFWSLALLSSPLLAPPPYQSELFFEVLKLFPVAAFPLGPFGLLSAGIMKRRGSVQSSSAQDETSTFCEGGP